MAYDLSSIKRGKSMQPPRGLIYGPHGPGKSTIGAATPSPIFIQTEDGLGTIDVPKFDLCATYADVMAAIYTLYQETHEFQTLVVDSADWLEPLVWAEACRIHQKADIEEFGYGKGYIAATDVWRSFLEALQRLRNDKGMSVILLSHTEIKRFDSPETEPYDRYQPKLHKAASALVQEWADMVLFLNYKTIVMEKDVGFNQKAARGISTGKRVVYTTEQPAFYAKNRYGMPQEIVIPDLPANPWQPIQDAIVRSAQPATPAPALPVSAPAVDAAVPAVAATEGVAA